MLMGKEYTISDFIKEYKEESLNFDKLQFKELISQGTSKMIMASDSILMKYNEELKTAIELITLSTSELQMFQYNPKYLSYHLYDTTELWFLLLHANEMYYTSQFDMNPVKVYNASIVGIIDRILTIEKPYIDMNRAEVKTI